MRTDRSRFRLQFSAAVLWLAGAALAVTWTVHSGQILVPAVLFSVMALVPCGMAVYADAEMPGVYETGMAIRAAGYSVMSGMVLIAAVLVVDHWAVTLILACVFALSRGVRRGQKMAYN